MTSLMRAVGREARDPLGLRRLPAAILAYRRSSQGCSRPAARPGRPVPTDLALGTSAALLCSPSPSGHLLGLPGLLAHCRSRQRCLPAGPPVGRRRDLARATAASPVARPRESPCRHRPGLPRSGSRLRNPGSPRRPGAPPFRFDSRRGFSPATPAISAASAGSTGRTGLASSPPGQASANGWVGARSAILPNIGEPELDVPGRGRYPEASHPIAEVASPCRPSLTQAAVLVLQPASVPS
jgi:hypothetical protein